MKAFLGSDNEYTTGKAVPSHLIGNSSSVAVSDASADGLCAYSLDEHFGLYVRRQLNDEEKALSSGFRELLAVDSAMKALENSATNTVPSTIIWLTDSTNLVAFLTKGSPKKRINDTVISILLTAKRIGTNIIPVHIARSDPRIIEADSGSRSYDSDNWSIDNDSFQKLRYWYGHIHWDMFADEENRKTERFFSYGASPGTSGVDAFANDWNLQGMWLSPPVRFLVPTFRKLLNCKGSGMIIIPEWRTGKFFTLFFPDGCHAHQRFTEIFKFQPIIKRYDCHPTAPFFGRPSFQFIALRFDTAPSDSEKLSALTCLKSGCIKCQAQ